MTDPVLFAIDDDPEELAAFERVLRRRYGADYRVIAECSPQVGFERLEQLASRAEEVALVVADQWLPGMTGIEFLMRAHELHPHARRALFVAPGDAAASQALSQAMVLGRVEYYLSKHWDPPDEYLFPVVSELLADWYRATRRSRHEMVRVVGRRWEARSHELRDLLERNRVSYGFYEAESEEGRGLLAEVGQDGSRLPVVITYNRQVLVDPSTPDLAAALGARTRPGPDVYDLVIVGAGPAGISAAVYGASEGLRTLVVETEALGGQAGTSSMIRNYLGFPHGISGGMLMSHASRQAMLFGAEFVYNRAAGLARRGRDFAVTLADGAEAVGRAVLLAMGVSYRRLGVSELEGLLGAGVFYGAAMSEAHAMRGQAVYVVGAGNSAGQAAIHLSTHAARVTLLVRGDTLAASMSDYLVREIGATPNLEVRLRTQVVGGGGARRLERLTLEDRVGGVTEEVPADALFILIGAEPRTGWLEGTVERDAAGYILTGADLVGEGSASGGRPLVRPARLLETSVPGVFAAGDVRRGSVKRVASAVGEGSIAIRSVHEYLSEQVPADAVIAEKGG